MSWIPLESNPDVMNEFMYKLGIKKEWQIVDVYGTDPEVLSFIPQPVLAVILLFPITEKIEEFMQDEEEKAVKNGGLISENLVYLKQYSRNACGTIALIHSIANNLDRIELSDGSLKKYLKSIKGLSPEEAGKLLMDEMEIAQVHDQMAEEGQTKAPDSSVDCGHHYVAFVEKDGGLYELDGRKNVPIKHGPTSKDFLLQDATKVVQKYMELDPINIQFTMMALAAS